MTEKKKKDINKNHSRGLVSGIFNVCRGCVAQKQRSVEDPRLQISGMTPLFHNDKHAFTLIELLVVVLIIGILSAIALPQYTKAVEKARGMQAIALLASFNQAQQAYHLANGTYATSFDELDITPPWTGSSTNVSNADWNFKVYATTSSEYSARRFYLERMTGKYPHHGFGILYDVWPGRIVCMEPNGSSTQGAYCEKIFNATVTSAYDGFKYYSLP